MRCFLLLVVVQLMKTVCKVNHMIHISPEVMGIGGIKWKLLFVFLLSSFWSYTGKICRLQNKLQSQMKNYQKIIDEQNKRIQAEAHEKERMHAQVVSFTQEIQELKSACTWRKKTAEPVSMLTVKLWISITNKLQTVYANPLCVKQNTFPLLSDFIA